MKIVIHILAFFLITGCSSNKEVSKLLKENTASYNKLKFTKTALTKSAVVYVAYNKESKNFKVELNSREPEEDISLQMCLVNKKEATIEASENSSYQWQNVFIVYSPESSKSNVLNCTLTSGDRFIITF